MAEVPLHRRALNKARDVRHHLAVRLMGTGYAEREWSSKSADQAYWDSRQAPHRNLLVKTITKYAPSSVLEVGCNTGPNLFRLSEALHEARLVGIDISEAAVEKGKANFEQMGITNVELHVGKADDLSRFPDKNFDVVFADAVLIYIGKDKIDAVANEMVRLARKAIILVEYHDPSSDGQGTFIYEKGYWKRDYTGLFSEREGVTDLKITKLSKELWDDAYWIKYGAIVEVELGDGRE